ncbi:MAG TPA: hypothetical protein VLR88_01030, partial [Propionibacteriaceae bacterium]|nr:hypothetical protein [Propionibacteriaceae bacterium]
MTHDDTLMTHDDSVDARVVRHLEPLWWRPSLQITGLVLWALGMLLGWYVQKPRAIPDVDMRILESFSQDRSPALITLSRWIELYDGPKVTPWLLVAALVVVFALGHRLLAILAVVMTALSWFPGHLAKRMFPRERPPESIDPVWIVEGANSYPSGHTGFIVAATIAGVFAWTVLRRPTVRRWWIVGGTLMTLL